MIRNDLLWFLHLHLAFKSVMQTSPWSGCHCMSIESYGAVTAFENR